MVDNVESSFRDKQEGETNQYQARNAEPAQTDQKPHKDDGMPVAISHY